MKYKEFKVGDKVICSIKGKGSVDYIRFVDSEQEYVRNPIRVKFDNGSYNYYTIHGELEVNYNRTLFTYERKYKKTKEEVMNKYKELLSELKLLPYQELEPNWYVKIVDDKNSYSINLKFVRYVDDFDLMYLSREDAEYIVEELKKFIDYKW